MEHRYESGWNIGVELSKYNEKTIEECVGGVGGGWVGGG